MLVTTVRGSSSRFCCFRAKLAVVVGGRFNLLDCVEVGALHREASSGDGGSSIAAILSRSSGSIIGMPWARAGTHAKALRTSATAIGLSIDVYLCSKGGRAPV